MRRSALLLIAAAAVWGCQTYDFQPVQPVSLRSSPTEKDVYKPLKPNVLVLVDKSGSMTETDPGAAASRMAELQSAMSAFLGQSNGVARFGLAVFPNSSIGLCAPTDASTVLVPLQAPALDDSAFVDTSSQVAAALQAVTPGGGTPTGDSLRALVAADVFRNPFANRDNYVLLLTDGLPNCNASNPNTCATPAACACTSPSGCAGPTCTLGCLDKDGAVAAVQALTNRGVKTIVVGFGNDTLTAGPVLDAMAQAGGLFRVCPNRTDAECGGASGACNQATGVCTVSYYQANNAQELLAVLLALQTLFPKPCEWALDFQPTDPKLIAVQVNGVHLDPGPSTWLYDAGKIVFQGAWCTTLSTATPQDKVHVSISVVGPL